MDVIEGRGVKALVYNPNKYERVSTFPHGLRGYNLLTPPSSANATIRSPTMPNKACRRKASSTTCSKFVPPAVLPQPLIPRSMNTEAFMLMAYHSQLLCQEAAVAIWALGIWMTLRFSISAEGEALWCLDCRQTM